MVSYAPHVYRETTQIALLTRRLDDLPAGRRVMLLLSGGGQVSGVVAAQPQLQSYLDCQQLEGVNALVRLDDLDRPLQQHVVWLDSIDEVRVLEPAVLNNLG